MKVDVLKKGQKVTITDAGKLYTTYLQMAVKLNAKRFLSHQDTRHNLIYTVKTWAPHEEQPNTLIVLIENEFESFLIEPSGISQCNKRNVKAPKTELELWRAEFPRLKTYIKSLLRAQ